MFLPFQFLEKEQQQPALEIDWSERGHHASVKRERTYVIFPPPPPPLSPRKRPRWFPIDKLPLNKSLTLWQEEEEEEGEGGKSRSYS